MWEGGGAGVTCSGSLVHAYTRKGFTHGPGRCTLPACRYRRPIGACRRSARARARAISHLGRSPRHDTTRQARPSRRRTTSSRYSRADPIDRHDPIDDALVSARGNRTPRTRSANLTRAGREYFRSKQVPRLDRLVSFLLSRFADSPGMLTPMIASSR